MRASHWAAVKTVKDLRSFLLMTGRYNLALERFEKIMRGHGVGFSPFNLWMLYVDYGFTLVALSRYEEAIEPLEKGLSRNAAVPHGQNALGYAYASLNQLQQAQDVLARGLEYDPDNPVMWSNLAVVWMVAGAFPQAAQGLEKALTIEPQNPVIIHNVMVLKGISQTGYLSEHPKLDLCIGANSFPCNFLFSNVGILANTWDMVALSGEDSEGAGAFDTELFFETWFSKTCKALVLGRHLAVSIAWVGGLEASFLGIYHGFQEAVCGNATGGFSVLALGGRRS
eukprot:symbB.v1.2.002733.t1/scaffold146.1/size298692/14